MTNEQGAKWLLQEMYDEGYRDIKIFEVYAYFVNPTFIENGGHFKVREHTPRIPCKVLGLGNGKKEYSIASLLGIVEWEKVPVDTPIVVNTTYGVLRRYFAQYDSGKVWYFDNGQTSWSAGALGIIEKVELCNVRLAENANN